MFSKVKVINYFRLDEYGRRSKMRGKATLTVIFVVIVLTALAWQSVKGASYVTDGLIRHWNFDEVEGDTVKNLWGDRDGTINGDAKIAEGIFGNGMEFDGNGDYILFDDSGLPEGDAPRTMSAWVKPEGAGVRSVVEWGMIGLCLRSGVLVLDGQFIKFVGAQNCDVTSNSSIPLSEWSLVTETYDGETMRIYLNGELDKEQDLALATQLTEGKIGAKVTQDTEWFNGVLDEVSIYDKALDADEIKQNFEAVGPALAVNPTGNLALTWGKIKGSRYNVEP